MKLKSILLAVACLTLCMPTMAQSADNEDEVVKIDRHNMNAYRPGEVIVKFKETGSVQMRAPKKAKFLTTRVNAVDQLFQTLGVDSVEELMPLTGSKPLPRRIRTYSGRDIEPKNLGKLYRIKMAEQANVFEAIEQLKALDEVEYAEPNYLVYAMSTGVEDSTAYVQEPLYLQQWGPAAINLPALWAKPKVTTKRPVIAILDTGVDIDHPDLAANIWTNTAEMNGASGQDDDNNGFKDDIHGWDFINQTGNIRDFNGHGTHCAGIAAAVGDNGIGITGANPDAYIMPVSVLQSNGMGDVATIIKGIDYAAQNGADVISMSFGGYGYSSVYEQALARAYASSVLVAAAGNDHKSIDYPYPCREHGAAPMYPAAFSFVLGVEASVPGGGLADFSNYDPTGPIYSSFGEAMLYNYELRAPGYNICSTFPNGRYKSLNGTSMACPLVAGAISRLLQSKADTDIVSKEVLFGDLIHSRYQLQGDDIDMLTVYNSNNSTRLPSLSFVGFTMTDTIVGDNDQDYDAGETIEIYPILRNDWGMARNIRIWMRTGYYNGGDWVADDTTLIHYLTDTVSFGHTLSSYAKSKSVNPIIFQISSNCADGRIINFTLFSVCEEAPGDTLQHHITISVNNGVEIGGMIDHDLTLYPDVHYIVTSNLAIADGITLTVKPGVRLLFKDGLGLSVSGTLICDGTPDSLIVLSCADGTNSWTGINGNGTLRYCLLEHVYTYHPSSNIIYENCVLEDINLRYGTLWSGASNPLRLFQSNLQNSQYYFSVGEARHSNIVNNVINDGVNGSATSNYYWGQLWDRLYSCNYFNNNPEGFSLGYFSETPIVITSHDPSYIGTADINKGREICWDIRTSTSTYASINLSNMLQKPDSLAHGIVWKVAIDGYDAQDEFDSIPALGVGTHRCDVYFNRPMDISKTPYISYGVRSPYTQHEISENGSWSADRTIYTAYFTISGKTQSDGLNRLYVADAEDNEHFEIPLENRRFNMLIESSGSMSTGLMATPGLGKVQLDWVTDEEDFEDLIGYNIYRWTEVEDSTGTYRDENGNWVDWHYEHFIRRDTILINQSLIDSQDTMYVDYDVVPGKPYYYVIKQMTTSLSNYDISKPVCATPLTSVLGDANGSMAVDVADVITEVNYISRQNPQPFIFEAADVNGDSTINIFDIVGTVNIIMHPDAQTAAINEGTAYYYVENGILYVESDAVMAGLQFSFAADSASADIRPLDALTGFEQVSQWMNDKEYFFMAYSMTGRTIGVGKTALLQIGDAEIKDIALSDAQGHNIVCTPMVSSRLDGTRFMPNTEKFIRNGHLYIRMGEKVYTATGALVE